MTIINEDSNQAIKQFFFVILSLYLLQRSNAEMLRGQKPIINKMMIKLCNAVAEKSKEFKKNYLENRFNDFSLSNVFCH